MTLALAAVGTCKVTVGVVVRIRDRVIIVQDKTKTEKYSKDQHHKKDHNKEQDHNRDHDQNKD